jgi:hypothetical protein
MDVHGPTPLPNLHRPLTMSEIGDPSPVVPDEPTGQVSERVQMEIEIKNSDALAELAGMDPKALAATERQEWHGR